MSMADILIGFLVAGGFFVAAIVSRMFRKAGTGIVIGGVAGIAVSVLILYYGLSDQLISEAVAAE
ncbi:hypothetical protein [Yoonia sp.]|uniref:hypothetical protein n=1 Tax=Yoonia sp. TaxID=2212373 RepID=UPI003F6C6924